MSSSERVFVALVRQALTALIETIFGLAGLAAGSTKAYTFFVADAHATASANRRIMPNRLLRNSNGACSSPVKTQD
jgi:hypothetical protein